MPISQSPEESAHGLQATPDLYDSLALAFGANSSSAAKAEVLRNESIFLDLNRTMKCSNC